MTSRSSLSLLLISLVATLACEGTPLEESCSGEAITDCLPYEYSILTEAEASPQRVPLDDPEADLSLRVAFDKCDAAPRPHVVSVVVRVGGGDAGEGARLVNLVELRDDGETFGDSVAGDGVIDVTVGNPFFDVASQLPANANVVLQFRARSPADCTGGMCVGGTCRSDELEIPYETGTLTMTMP